jgi:type VI secretion system FHA domain protein
MQLVLDVVKYGKNRPQNKSFRFEKEGGAVGRSSECDFILNDPQNYISSRHFIIEYKYGKYYLIDESTNGTFLKVPYKKIPKGQPHLIKASEVYIVGDHELQARFSDSDDTDEYIVGGLIDDEIDAIEPVEELIPDDFLEDDAYIPEEVAACENEDKTLQNEDVLDLLDEKELELQNESSGDDDDLIDAEFEKDASYDYVDLARIEASDTRKKRVYEHSGYKKSLQLLEKRLGVDIVSLEDKDRDVFLNEICDVLINSIDGIKNSLYVKDRIKQDLRLPAKFLEQNNKNPVKLGESVSQLLENEKRGGRLGLDKLSVAITKSFAEIDAHSLALHGASKNLMHIALSEFAPKHLEYKFEANGALKGVLPKQCMMWKAYEKKFETLNHNPEELVKMLLPHFTKEYEKFAFSSGLVNLHNSKDRSYND